jgi:hypothetical protein
MMLRRVTKRVVVRGGEMSDILLGNVLKNHIYEEEMESRRLAET